MREIKFRAWQKAYITQFTIDDKLTDCNIPAEMIYYFNTVSHGETNFFNFSFVNKDRYELMQFTGLYDKNGKEIYEGDIVKEINDKNKCPDNYLVEFDEGCAGWLPFTYHGWDLSPNCSEIIGNIHENKELLNE